jgi:hypothetical protein
MTKGPDGSDRRENAFGLTGGGPTPGKPLAARMRADETCTRAAGAPTMQALSVWE